MKNLFVTALALLIVSTMALAQKVKHDYVVTQEQDVIFCEDVRQAITGKFICTLTSGEKMKVKSNDIQSYSINGKFFEKLPLYKGIQNTGKEVFMELVGYRSGLKLFKYYDFNRNGEPKAEYFVFNKGGDFVVDVRRNENCKNMMNLFASL